MSLSKKRSSIALPPWETHYHSSTKGKERKKQLLIMKIERGGWRISQWIVKRHADSSEMLESFLKISFCEKKKRKILPLLRVGRIQENN